MTSPEHVAAEALKPCPFCGGEAAPNGTVNYSEAHVRDQQWDQSTFFFCNCTSCGVSNQGIVGHRSRELAIAAWNRRPAPASHANAVKALEWRGSADEPYASGLVGSYKVSWSNYANAFLLTVDGCVRRDTFPTAEAAQAAAQADYERRILSALTASPSPAGAVPATHVHSWIVGSGDGKSWRTWTSGSPAWTEDREQATRFARREDAEAVHREDEDAWRVVPYQDLPNDADEAYEIGVRDGYEDAVQDLDLATGGDGEFRGSGIPGRAVDVPIMKQRIIDRFVGVPVSPAGAVAPAAGVVEALLDLRDQILRGKRCLTDTGTAVKPIIEVSKVHVLDSAANEIERLAALQPAPHPDTDSGGGQADGPC